MVQKSNSNAVPPHLADGVSISVCVRAVLVVPNFHQGNTRKVRGGEIRKRGRDKRETEKKKNVSRKPSHAVTNMHFVSLRLCPTHPCIPPSRPCYHPKNTRYRADDGQPERHITGHQQLCINHLQPRLQEAVLLQPTASTILAMPLAQRLDPLLVNGPHNLLRITTAGCS